MHRIVFLLATAAGLGACNGMGNATTTSGPPAATVVLADTDFDLAVGKSAHVDGTTLTITFNGVTADSRCPLGVFCIQAGNATLSLTAIDGAGRATPISLYPNPTPTTPDSVKIGGYEISLVALQPIRRRDVTIPPEGYVATLHVSKG